MPKNDKGADLHQSPLYIHKSSYGKRQRCSFRKKGEELEKPCKILLKIIFWIKIRVVVPKLRTFAVWSAQASEFAPQVG